MGLSPSTSQWADLQKIKIDNPVLAPLVEDVKAIVRAGTLENTNKQYDLYFKKFTEWCCHYNYSALPADVCTVVLYISYLVQKNASVSVLNSNVFSISCKHNYHLLKNPCEEKFAIFTVDGARNFLSKPITKKEPMYDHYGVSSDLSDLRIYCMFSLAFAVS